MLEVFHLAVALSAMILISLAGAASAAASESAIQLEDLAQPGELVEASISNLEPGSRYTLQVEGSEAVVAAVAGNVIVESYSGKTVEFVARDASATFYIYPVEAGVYAATLYQGSQTVAQAQLEVQQPSRSGDTPLGLIVDDSTELLIAIALLTGSQQPTGVEVLTTLAPASNGQAIVLLKTSITIEDSVIINVDTTITRERGVEKLIIMGASGGVPAERVNLIINAGAVLRFEGEGEAGLVVKLASLDITLDSKLGIKLGAIQGFEIQDSSVLSGSNGIVEAYLPSYSSLSEALSTGIYINLDSVNGLVRVRQTNSDLGKVLAVRLGLSGPPWPGLELASTHHNVPVYIVEGPYARLQQLSIRGVGVLAVEPGSVLRVDTPLNVILEGSYLVSQLPVAAIVPASTSIPQDQPLILTPELEVVSNSGTGGSFSIAGVKLESDYVSIGSQQKLSIAALSYVNLDADSLDVGGSRVIIGKPPEGLLPVKLPEGPTSIRVGSLQVEADELLVDDSSIITDQIFVNAGAGGVKITGSSIKAGALSVSRKTYELVVSIGASILSINELYLPSSSTTFFSSVMIAPSAIGRIGLARDANITFIATVSQAPLEIHGKSNSSSVISGILSIAEELKLYSLDIENLNLVTTTSKFRLEAYEARGSITIARDGWANMEVSAPESRLNVNIIIWGGSLSLEKSSLTSLTIKTTRDDLSLEILGDVLILKEAVVEASYWSTLEIIGNGSRLSVPSITLSAPEGRIALEEAMLAGIRELVVDTSEDIPEKFEAYNTTVLGGENSTIAVNGVEVTLSSTTLTSTHIQIGGQTISLTGVAIQGGMLEVDADRGLSLKDVSIADVSVAAFNAGDGTLEARSLYVDGCTTMEAKAVEGYIDLNASCGGEDDVVSAIITGAFTIEGRIEGGFEAELSEASQLDLGYLEVNGNSLNIWGSGSATVNGVVNLYIKGPSPASVKVSGVYVSLYINVDGKLETQHLTIASTPVEGFLQISSTGGLDVNLSDVYNVSLSINTGGDTVITLPQDSSASHGLQLEVVSTGYLTVRDGIVTSDSIRLLGGKVFIYNASLNAGELWMEGDEVSVSSGVLNAETAITIASPLIYLVSSDVKAEELYIQYDIEYGAGLVVAVDSSLGSQPESPGMILDFRSGFTTISVESTLSLSSIQVESASYSILSLVSSTLESKSLTISASQEGALDLVSLSSRVNIDNKLSIVSGGVSLELLSSTFNAGECEIAEGSIIESVASDVNNGCSVNVPLETVDYTGWSVRLGSSEEASGELLLRIAEGPEYMVSYVAVGGWYIYVALVSTPSSNVVLELEIPSTDCKDILIADPLSGNVVGVGKAIEKDGGCLLTSSLVLETPSRLFLALEYLEPDVEKVTYTTTTTVTTTQTLTETISHTQTLVRTTTTSEFILSTTTETLESTIEKTVERTLESTVTYTQWETRTVEARSTAPWAVAAALAAVIAGLLGYMLLRGRVS